MDRLRIIVTGLIGQYPLGGVTWDYVQYALGLHRLGHDVYYFEDTGQWPYNPVEGGIAKDCTFNIEYLGSVMDRFGLGDRWAYRFPWQSQWFGLTDRKRQEVLDSADILINVSGTLAQPEHYRRIPLLVYIDSDPVFTQVKLAKEQNDFRRMVETHDVHFSFGETSLRRGARHGYRLAPDTATCRTHGMAAGGYGRYRVYDHHELDQLQTPGVERHQLCAEGR